jgi:long-chain fatty acid transport protein
MNGALLKTAAWAGLISVLAAGAANAGGFSRGTAPTDILYEDGNFDIRFDARVVMPHQEFSKSANPALIGTNSYETYVIPSAAVKFNISDSLRCAGTYTQNNGADMKYAAPKLSPSDPFGVPPKLSENFHTDEFGLTCAVRFAVGPGVLSVLGGGFAEELTYDRVSVIGGGATANLELSGQEYGWRGGIAYEIPEIKLRAEVLYRSGTEYGAEGKLGTPFGPVPAVATGNLPQSAELNLRSGVAPGWLVFGQVKWTDWSVLNALTVVTPALPGPVVDTYNWRDGWTLTGGVVHSFSETFAGQVSLTWDQGVSTGWDLKGDVWSFALGGRVRAPVGGEFRFGAGVAYLEGVEETQYAAPFNEATDNGYAIGLNVGYIVQW